MIPLPEATLDRLNIMVDFLAAAPPGDVVEVGVYQGGSLYYLASRFPARQFFGFDTFTGMPQQGEHDNFHKPGDFVANYEDVREALSCLPNITLVKGVFPASDTIRPRCIMAHVDVDLYVSTRDAFEHLTPLMLPGGRIYCDDAYAWTCEGATKAYEEYCRKYNKPIQSCYAYVNF